MGNKNRFTAAKEKMDSNYEESIENDEENEKLGDSIKSEAESREIETKHNQEVEQQNLEVKVDKPRKSSKPEVETKIEMSKDLRMTRKTTAMPLVLALAVKEIKDRRNLAQQKGKGRTTDDDIIVEALTLYFSQKGEFNESLGIAETRLRNYS